MLSFLNAIKSSITSTIGFIFSQPITITLRQFYAVQVCAVVYSFALLTRLLDFYLQHADLTEPTAAAQFWGFCALLFGTTWVAVKEIRLTTDTPPHEGYEPPLPTTNQ